jgi:oligopeptide transport system substrate-binding protein
MLALMLAAFLVLACSLTDRLLPSPDDTPTAPAGGPTGEAPAATPRPLADIVEEPGRYRNDILGISLEYPEEWIREPGAEEAGDLLGLHDPSETALVVLTYDFLTGTDYQHSAAEIFDSVAQGSGLRVAVRGEAGFRLAGGEAAWRGIAEDDAASGERLEMVAVPRSGRLILLFLMARAGATSEMLSVLDEVRESLGVFDPLPFGVDRSNALFLSAEEPETLDPALWEADAGGIIGDLFSGLVQLDPRLQPVPDLAESWDVSSDLTTYTFHLREGVLFHDGSGFTAQDVVFSWERACSPATESNTAGTYLGDIRGVDEMISGEASHISGLRLIDDHTLEVTLEGPRAYFLAKLAYPTSWVVDEGTVDRIEEAPNGTGPFVMARHVEDEVIVVARNPYYHRGPVPLEYIVYQLYPGPLQSLYEDGQVDIAYIGEDLLDRARDPEDPLFGDAQPTSDLCTWYAAFDAARPPFDEAIVRRAFSLAVDREEYVEVTAGGQGAPAAGLYPPGLPGFRERLAVPPPDIDEARRLLQQSSYGGADALPEIVLTTSGYGMGLPPGAAFLTETWRDAFGLEVRVEQLDSETYYDQLYAGNHGNIILTGWCADYPDPENFADILFHSGSAQNFGDYSSAEVDVLLERGRAEPEVERRLALYAEVEDLLLGDAAAIFLSHPPVYYTLVKLYVHGHASNPIGTAQHMNLWIDRGE